MPVSFATLLLADARMPAGGHVSSGGWEPALLGGFDQPLDAYIDARLEAVSPIDIGASVVARRIAIDDGDVPASLDRVRAEWAARTPNAHLRAVACDLGLALHRLAATMLGEPFDLPAPRTGRAWPRPIVAGFFAARAGIGSRDLVRALVYDEVQSVCAASLKLQPADPAAAARTVLAACQRFEHRVDELAGLTEPAHIPIGGAALLEQWAQHHANTTRRLFRA